MNRKERLRSEMGVDTPKKKKEAYAPIFYESETLAESAHKDVQKKDSDAAPEINRRNKRAKPQKKSGELNRNTNYRSNWQSEE